jgi:phosphate starvation-inducible PhoH-like protein
MKTPLFLFFMISGAACYTSFSLFTPLCNRYLQLVNPRGNIDYCDYSDTSFLFSLCPRRHRSISSELSMRASRVGGETKSNGQKQKSLAPVYSPKTANQKTYCGCLSDPKAAIVLGVGPAGTGKTLFACIRAIQMLRSGEIHKIVLTRPVVAVEEELGFLPGNMVMKMDPWTRPIFDIFLEFYSQKDVDAMVQSGTIEISPLAYMRGRTFKRAFIIADEMQNSSPNQMLMLITRIGEGSKMVITGDLKQSDRVGNNGLQDFMQKIYGKNVSGGTSSGVVSVGGIRAIELAGEDVERSVIVKQVLDLYEPAKVSLAVCVESLNVTTSKEREPSTPTVVHCFGDIANNTNISSPNTTHINSFELVDSCVPNSYDAALIPKHHTSKHFQGENYGQFSSGKWLGW